MLNDDNRNRFSFYSKSGFRTRVSVKVPSLTSTTIEYADLSIGYGLSETTGGVIHQIEEEEHAWGCVGKVLPGMYVARSIFYLLSCLKTHC
jgi:hypothetical protein